MSEPAGGYHGLFPTRWNDNDQYAHVNNAVYYEAMDTTINTWLITVGVCGRSEAARSRFACPRPASTGRRSRSRT